MSETRTSEGVNVGEHDAPLTLTSLSAGGRATLSVEEAGQLLGIGRHAAYTAARSGQLPTIRLGRRLRVPVPRLLALLGS